MLGHTMGAASCFGAIASVLGIAHDFIPPTINHGELDPELEGFDVVPNEAREAELHIVQNNGFAFGGNNAITIFGRPDDVTDDAADGQSDSALSTVGADR